MDRNELILILLILMAVILAFELAYIMLRRKRREQSMFRRKTEPVETVADRARNLIITTESISKTLANQGINTYEADALLREARTQETARDYGAAVERAEAAKLVLLRLKREKTAAGPGHRDPAPGDPERRPMNQSIYDSVDTPLSGDSASPEPAEREKTDLDSLPANYIQAKFMLSTTKDQLDRLGISGGEAFALYVEAKGFFDDEDYSRALSQAIKAGRLLDSDSVGLIAQETADTAEEVIYVCPNCDSEISEDDVFCRECGQNLQESKCPGCGEPIDANDKFCRKCGKKLG